MNASKHVYRKALMGAGLCMLLLSLNIKALDGSAGAAPTTVEIPNLVKKLPRLVLIDPFPKEAVSKSASMSWRIESPNSGTGSTWIYDTNLPFSGSKDWGKTVEENGASAWCAVHASEGFINVIVEKAQGNAYIKAYTRGLPSSAVLEGNGAVYRAMASVAVWAPSPNGKPQPQRPGLLGLIIWEKNHARTTWEVERWEWPGTSPSRVEIASGTDALDFGKLRDYVNQIANGREIRYYEISAEANSSYRSDDAKVHARLNFPPTLKLYNPLPNPESSPQPTH